MLITLPNKLQKVQHCVKKGAKLLIRLPRLGAGSEREQLLPCNKSISAPEAHQEMFFRNTQNLSTDSACCLAMETFPILLARSQRQFELFYERFSIFNAFLPGPCRDPCSLIIA
jgi:hypothetical protein